MLTEAQIQENKIKYLSLLSKLNIDLTDLTDYLNKVDYFVQPATYQAFKAYPGGLCEYAIALAYELGNLVNAYAPGKYTSEDILKVALFRDLYRAEMTESYLKNIKNEVTGQWETQLAYRTKEERNAYGDIGFSSYMVAKKFISFTDEQIEAITQTRFSDYNIDTHVILRQYPLAALVKMADIAVSYLGE